jgi:Zn-dependent M32 family carboxypeptidase
MKHTVFTKADKKAILEAIEEATSRREQRARNLDVMARADDSSASIPQATAKKLLRVLNRKMKAVETAVEKLK